MSAIDQNLWLPYLRPSYGGRPTENSSLQAIRNTAELSRPARDPRLLTSHGQIDRLASLRTNWDGHGSIRPNGYSVDRARQILEDAFQNASTTIGWQSPYISASEDGEIVFEWWNGARKLTMYVGPNVTTFIRSWGPHVIDDMVDGVLTENWDPSLWTWLFE
jgi:hypothetical protein